ncbi:MAG: PQQ-binding-like beta-propeller repeat protein [Armatimonadota bacterium]
MDYRSRWQQKRRERATRQRLVLLVAALAVIGALVLLVRGIARPAPAGYQLPGETVSWLTACDDGVIVTTRTGELLKLTADLETLSEGWTGPFTHPAGFWGRAAVLGRHLVVGCEDVRIRAVDVVSGVQSWEFGVRGAVPAVSAEDGSVYFASAEPALYRVSADGAMVWRTPLRDEVASSPMVRSEMVVVGTLGGEVCAYERSTGEERWCVTPELPAAIYPRPSMGPSSILVGDDRGRLHSIARSGEMLTSMQFEGLIRQAVAVGDAIVIAGDSSGLLRRINPADMTERWQTRLPGPLAAEPVIAGGAVWCGAGRSLVEIDPEDGSTVSRRDAAAQTSDVIAAHGRIYWATTDGHIGAVTIAE